MKKLVSSLISGLLVFSGVSLAPIARAAETEPRVFLSDYTPVTNQQVRLYFEGLEPYTEYSYGYVFAIGDVMLPSLPGFYDSVGELGTFTTNAIGKKEIEFYWQWSTGPDIDNMSSAYLGYLYVTEVGLVPTEPSDVLGLSELWIAGHKWGLENVSVTGSALEGDYFELNKQVILDITDIGGDYDTYQIFTWAGDASYWEIWQTGYESSWQALGILDYGELSPGQEALVINTGPNRFDRMLVVFASTYASDAGWMILDGNGDSVWVDDPHDYANVEDQVKPYTWTEGYYGSEDSFFEIQVSTPKKCFANGNDLIFMSPGKCSWKIFDAQSNYVFSDSATITASAPEDASFPLEVLHLKFAKGKSALTSKMMSRIEDFAYFLDFLDFYVAGHSYDEGTKKSMTALAKARTIAVKNYLRIGAEKVIANTSMGNASPFGNAANSRRVDVISLPVDDWTDFW